MDQIADMARKIDRRAGGSIGMLNVLFKAAMKQIRKNCKTEEEFEAKCDEFLNTACSCMGEEHREFYQEYMSTWLR